MWNIELSLFAPQPNSRFCRQDGKYSPTNLGFKIHSHEALGRMPVNERVINVARPLYKMIITRFGCLLQTVGHASDIFRFYPQIHIRTGVVIDLLLVPYNAISHTFP